MKLFLVAVALVAALAGATGCGGGSQAETAPRLQPVTRKLDITLDGYQGPENLGILMAQKLGYFKDVGLDIWIRTPAFRVAPLQYVVGGAVALAVSHQPQVVSAASKGAPAVAFGSLISQPTASLIWLKKSKIAGIADLKGKTIAITGLPFEREFLEAILARAGLTLADVKLVRADYELVPELVSGRVDAILGSWNLEGAELEAKGLNPVITKVQSLGIPAYEELVLTVWSGRLAREPGVIRKFMSAVTRGTAAAVEHPRAAANLIANLRAETTSPSLKAEVAATLPLLSESGEIDAGRVSALVEWMHREGLVQREPALSDFLAEDYLASQSE